MTSVTSPKADIRRHLLHDTRQLSPSSVLERSQRLCQRLLHHPRLAQARSVALYRALPGEVTLEPLFEPLHRAGKRLYLPRVDAHASARMSFYAWAPGDALQCSRFGIEEPLPASSPALPGEIDLFLVPGVGFDHQGVRLGRGKGYYDRALGPFMGHAWCVGVCFALQRVEQLPHDPWDLLMHEVVTEDGCYVTFRGGT